jgi:hypothetical protein
VIKTRFLCMISPVGSRQLLAARTFTLTQRASYREEKTQLRLARAALPSASRASVTRLE